MIRYSADLIDEVMNNSDIVEIISQYVELKRSGRNFVGLCPFHTEKTPSFCVSPDKQIFHCFGCGEGGNVFHFISKVENMNFKEAVELLAEKANIALPILEKNVDTRIQNLKNELYKINQETAHFYHENLYKPIAKQAQEYIKKRNLNNKTLKDFCIGYSGNFNELYNHLKKLEFSEEAILASGLVNKNDNGQYIDRFRRRLMFPIQDTKNKFIAFGGRVLDDSKPKYINSPENYVYSKGKNLYGLNISKKDLSEKIIVVEGYMDVISLYQRGVTNVVASLGTALTEKQGYLLRRYSKQVVIGYDSDEAGQNATMRGLDILNALGCDVRILQLSGAKDPDEFIIKYGKEKFEYYVKNSISLIEFKIKNLKEKLNLDSTNDVIKFLNEIAKILSTIDNNIEREIYIERISQNYKVSKEAIQSEINKLLYNKNTSKNKLNKFVKPSINKVINEGISETVLKRERLIISLLLNAKLEAYNKLKNNIFPDDLKSEINKQILKNIYDEFEKGNININEILNFFEDNEVINYITSILSEEFYIDNIEKGTQDIINIYIKEKLNNTKNEIIQKLNSADISKEEQMFLEQELRNIVMNLAKIK